VSITVGDGALTALLGPSGSGKSTLLRVIAGLETPDTGEVVIGEHDVTDAPARTRGVGFVFQHYAPFKHMTVNDNVAFGLSVRKRPKDEIRAPREGAARTRAPGRARRALPVAALRRTASAHGAGPRAGGPAAVLLLDEPFGRSMRKCAPSCANGCASCTRRST